MKRFAILLLSFLSFVSCMEFDEPLFYFNEMADVSGGCLVTDNGLKYKVTDGEMSANIASYSRVYVQGYATKSYEAGSTYDYDVKIESMWQVAVKDLVKVSSIQTEEDDTYGDSPILMSQSWLSGGYLNFILIVSHRRTQNYMGSVSLLYDDTKSSSNELFFELRNKQEGDTWENPEMDESSTVFENLLLSVPIESLIPAGMSTDQLKLNVEYKWFDAQDGAILPLHTTKVYSGTCTIE